MAEVSAAIPVVETDPVAEMPFSDYCVGTASVAETRKTKLTSAALTSTRPPRPSRAWNPRRLRLNPTMVPYPTNFNGHANATEDIDKVITQEYLRKTVDVVPMMNVIGPFTLIHTRYVGIAQWDLDQGLCAASAT